MQERRRIAAALALGSVVASTGGIASTVGDTARTFTVEGTTLAVPDDFEGERAYTVESLSAGQLISYATQPLAVRR